VPLYWCRQVNAATVFARWRVRLGYPLAIVVLLLSRPSPRSILAGAIVGAVGLWIRASAAGHLHKQEVLTVTGPYGFTRNPLYLGSFFLMIGAAVAARSWWSALILFAYFALFYSFVMRREERELFLHHGEAFREYARTVPLFFPRMTPAKSASGDGGAFSFAQYKKNREYRAAIGFLLLLLVFVVIWRLRSL
jgi:protein-S-isoprenylcysteine O-methyltransferase Ste14